MAALEDTHAALEREWAEFLVARNSQGKKTLAENWRTANPGEWTQLQAYRAGGVRPSPVTSLGRQMVEHLDAWHASSAPPVMGAALAAAYPPLSGLAVVDYAGAVITTQQRSSAGRQHWRRFVLDNAKPIAIKLEGGEGYEITDGEIRNMVGVNAQYGYQGIHVAHGVADVRIRRLCVHDIGGTTGDKFSHAVYVHDGTRILLESVLAAPNVSGEVFQFYPGGPVQVDVVNCTFGWSLLQEAVVAWGETGPVDVTVRNSVVGGNIQLGVNATLRIIDSMVLSTVAIPAAVELTNVTRSTVDAQYRPVNGMVGDPEWTPVLDVYGTARSSALVGAVA